MILGFVTSGLEATIRLHVEDATGQSQAIDVKIDTGFSGFMSLPGFVVSVLKLPWLYEEAVLLADGSVVKVDVHSVIVLWNGKARRVDVHAMGTNRLIGMGMLAAHELRIVALDGGPVSIDAVP